MIIALDVPTSDRSTCEVHLQSFRGEVCISSVSGGGPTLYQTNLTLVGSAAATVHRLRTDHRTWKVLEEELGAGEPSKSTCTGKWDYISHSLARPSKQTFNGSHRINLVSLCLTKSNPV